MSALDEWGRFYVIVGGAGGLIGLQLVVMFAVGGAALLLLFVGIHNSWDAIAYHVLVRRRKETQR